MNHYEQDGTNPYTSANLGNKISSIGLKVLWVWKDFKVNFSDMLHGLGAAQLTLHCSS
jgi:hypothetical protein